MVAVKLLAVSRPTVTVGGPLGKVPVMVKATVLGTNSEVGLTALRVTVAEVAVRVSSALNYTKASGFSKDRMNYYCRATVSSPSYSTV